MVYKDQQHKIQATIFRKPTDQQTYLHAQSNFPKSLQDSIPYTQALHIKTIIFNYLWIKKKKLWYHHKKIQRKRVPREFDKWTSK